MLAALGASVPRVRSRTCCGNAATGQSGLRCRADVRAAAAAGSTGRFGTPGGSGSPECRPSACRATCVSGRDSRIFEQFSTDPYAGSGETPAHWAHARDAHATNSLVDEPVASTSGCETTDLQRSWNRWDWAAGYGSCTDCPEGYWLEVQGELPLELEGTYFRNGPGRLDIGGRDRVAHPFDGDGLICSISISKGRAFFRSRFVNTAERRAEEEAGHRMFRGSFGTQLSGGFWRNFLELVPRNAANTSVVLWGGRCLALFEAGQPYRLDPATLETQGVDTLGGVLREGLPFSSGFGDLVDGALGSLLDACGVSSPTAPSSSSSEGSSGGVTLGGDAFSAHPHTCSATGRLVSFSYSIRVNLSPSGLPGLKTTLTFYELDPDMNLVSSRDYFLDGYAFVHDFQVTDGHYVLIQNPVKLDLAPFLLGTKAPVQCVKFQPDEPARVHLIPRPEPGQLANRHRRIGQTPEQQQQSSIPPLAAKVIDADPCFVFHLSEAKESHDGSRFTVDCIRYPNMPDFDDLMGHGAGFEYVRPECQPPSQLWRLEVDKGAEEVTSFRQVTPRVMEFPCAAPQPGVPRYTYAAAALHPTLNMPQQALVRVDMESGAVEPWSRGDRYYVGEPSFVPRRGGECPDDGWLVALCFDAEARASEAVVLDARHVADGPIAVLRLREQVPHGLHGHWSEECHAPPPGGMEATAVESSFSSSS